MITLSFISTDLPVKSKSINTAV